MPRRPSPGNIASPYGWRTHPLTKQRHLHAGEDIGHVAGIRLVAPIACRVVSYARAGGHGNRMLLTGLDPLARRVEIGLSHLAAAAVSAGADVPEGHYIADMGATGNVDGVHVHWEVRVNGVLTDPAEWLKSLAAFAGSSSTPIRTGDRDMHMARHPNGAITLIGETTYQHLSAHQYANNVKAYGDYIQYSAEGYQQQLNDIEFRAQTLAARLVGKGAGPVDPAAVASKVRDNLTADFERLADQIDAINVEVGAPSAEEIAQAFAAKLATKPAA